MIYNFSTNEKIRLDEFLRRELPGKVAGSEGKQSLSQPAVSNSKIRRLIISGSVSVNGRPVLRPAFELRGKSLVTVNFESEKFFFEKQPDDITYEVRDEDVLFEDDYIIVLNKPCHFPTEATIVGDQKRDNLHAALVRYLWKKNPFLRNPPYAGIMHRLDRDTSGAILFTKTRSVNKAVQEMFEGHSFTKIYQALCTQEEGRSGAKESYTPGKTFTVEGFMKRASLKSQAAKWTLLSEGKNSSFHERKGNVGLQKKEEALYSKTQFKILEKCEYNRRKCLRLQAELFTGRTHQIRVHLSSSGLPILGDTLYGGKEEERIFLHAWRLSFAHPVTGETIEITAPLTF
ncbi:MAG: RluA family pseudouridine synthase [Treponema sp.]|nr:RluA family pseudouridine synthase [Treponema sp.]